jgi:hypothetical protein
LLCALTRDSRTTSDTAFHRFTPSLYATRQIGDFALSCLVADHTQMDILSMPTKPKKLADHPKNKVVFSPGSSVLYEIEPGVVPD